MRAFRPSRGCDVAMRRRSWNAGQSFFYQVTCSTCHHRWPYGVTPRDVLHQLFAGIECDVKASLHKCLPVVIVKKFIP